MNVFILFIVLIASIKTNQAIAYSTCGASNVAKFECVSKNFEAVYRDDPKTFFIVLDAAADKDRTCTNPKGAVPFFNLAGKIKGNAELGEYFAEKIEALAVKNPKCAIEVFHLLKGEAKARFLLYLKDPLFSKREDIIAALKTQSEHKKFSGLMNAITK